jgi:hypothetical protein
MLPPSSVLAAHASSTPPETGPNALPIIHRAASTPSSMAGKGNGVGTRSNTETAWKDKVFVLVY